MKRKIFNCVFFLLSSTAFCQDTYSYKTYSTVIKNDAIIYKLEYGVNSHGYNGQVRWRFTNYSDITLYDVMINDKKYTLSSGETKGRSGEMMTSTLGPGKSVSSVVNDYVNSGENYGTYSDKNDNQVVDVSVKEPVIRFKIDKKGKSISWEPNGAENAETSKVNNTVSYNSNSKESQKSRISNTIQYYKQESSLVQNQNQTNIDYNQTLKKADESFYSGDYSKALELYNEALKSGGATDKYIKEQIASLNKSGIKMSNTLKQSEKKEIETNMANLYMDSYRESPKKTYPAEKRNSRYNSKEAENIISKYKELLDEYLIAFKKSLSGDDIDMNNLLKKTAQLEEFYNNYLVNDKLFTEEFLDMIGKITESFTEAMTSLAVNISFENENEKRKYIQAKSPFIPAIKSPGSAVVDQNPKQISGGYTTPSNGNTLPANVEAPTGPPGVRAPIKEKKK
jgi:hypothetical protein